MLFAKNNPKIILLHNDYNTHFIQIDVIENNKDHL